MSFPSIEEVNNSVNATTEYGAPCVVNVFTIDQYDPYVTLKITAPREEIVGIVRVLGSVGEEDESLDPLDFNLYSAILAEATKAMPEEDFNLDSL